MMRWLALSGRTADEGDAVEVLIDRIRTGPGELTLVTLGPLTNVAEAFERGQTVIDHLRLTDREPNADVVLEASRERFDSLLKLTLA